MRTIRHLWWVLFGLIGLAAAVLTGFRLADPTSGVGVRVVAFTPLGLLLWGLLSVGLLVKVVIGPHRIRVLMATTLTLVPILLHLWWLQPLYLGPQPEPAPAATPVRLLTLNAELGQADAVDVVQTVLDRDVNVLVLAEISDNLLSRLEAAGLSAVLPHRVGEPDTGASGTVIFAAWELVDPVRLSSTFGSWQATLAAPDGPWRIAGVHVSPPIGTATAWRDDLTRLRGELTGVDVVAGDFNAIADHAPFRRLLDVGLRDAGERSNAGWHPTWPVNQQVLGVAIPPIVQIDHVLVGRRIAVVEVEVIEVTEVDHKAVLAVLAQR